MTASDARPTELHIIVHARPDAALERQLVTLFGQMLPSWLVSPSALSRPLPVDFEQAVELLAALPRMFIEPDGSFVWVSEREAERWQIDGQLHDSAAGLLNVELKINGSSSELPSILRCLGWPAQPLMFQLVEYGIYVDEAGLWEIGRPDLPSQTQRMP